jgi:hypothetical protein
MGSKPVFGLAGLLLASTTLTGCWGDRDTMDAGRFTPPPPGSATRPQFGGQQPYSWPRPGNNQQPQQQSIQSPMMGGDPSSAQYPSIGGSQPMGQAQPANGVQPMTQNPMMGGGIPPAQNPAMGGSTSTQWSTPPANTMGRSTSMNTPGWPTSAAVGPQSGYPGNPQFSGNVTNAGNQMAGGANLGMNPSALNSANPAPGPQVSQSTLRFAGNPNAPSPFASRPLPPISNEVAPPDVSRPTPPAGYPAFQSGTGSASSANAGLTPVGYNQGAMGMAPAPELPPPTQPGSFNSQSRYSGEIHDVSGNPPSPMGVPTVPVLRQGL